MPGGATILSATTNPERVEAPVTMKAYLLCVFAVSVSVVYTSITYTRTASWRSRSSGS